MRSLEKYHEFDVQRLVREELGKRIESYINRKKENKGGGAQHIAEEIQEECGGNDQALKLVSADYIAFLALCTLKTS